MSETILSPLEQTLERYAHFLQRTFGARTGYGLHFARKSAES